MNGAEEVYLLETIKSLYGLKSTAEKAIEQVTEDEMYLRPDPESNNLAILIKHMSGNMISRFTDFLTTDGEKAWRNRDEEFVDEHYSREKLVTIWNEGWECLFSAMAGLKNEDLLKTVYIREEAYTVVRALQRQLVHYAYHTGQIVYICKHIRSKEFQSLSIPRTSKNPTISNRAK